DVYKSQILCADLERLDSALAGADKEK
ncbi:hypothetical protein ACV33Y_34655, partial [Pseudomonas aeruginosa]